MKIILTYQNLNLEGEVVGILPVSTEHLRPKELYKVKYNNGKYGVIEDKDFIEGSFEYHTSNHFNENDTYLFEDLGRTFESKVHFYNGAWYTNESLQFKATTIKCIKTK